MSRCDATGPRTGWRCCRLSTRADHHSHTAYDPAYVPRGGQDRPFEHWCEPETDDVAKLP